MATREAQQQDLAKVLAAYCRAEKLERSGERKPLAEHFEYIHRLSISAMAFLTPEAKKDFERTRDDRREAFWRQLEAQLAPAERGPAEEALTDDAFNAYSSPLPSMPSGCLGSASGVLGEAQAGARVAARRAASRGR